MRIVYFVSDGIFSGVLDSQVLTPLRLLGEKEPTTQRAAVFLTSVRHLGREAIFLREEEIRKAVPGIILHFKYRLMNGFPGEHRLWALQLERSLRMMNFTGNKPIIIHCRGDATASATAILKRRDSRLRILLDIRGAQSDEIVVKGLLGRYLRCWAEHSHRLAMKSADGVNTVSHKMADHFINIGEFPGGLPRSVVGCCVDTHQFYFDPTQRAARREELGLQDKFVICYCGAMSHWQRPDALVEAFAAIRAAMPDAHLLAVTKEAQPLREQLARVGVAAEDVTIRSAPHDQVASYLMAADVGILLRENTLTNRVASPVKFAEYLRCGLPVILTPYVGDYGEFAQKYDVGRMIEFPIHPAQVAEVAQLLRGRLLKEGLDYRNYCSGMAGEKLSWSSSIACLLDTYRKLNQ